MVSILNFFAEHPGQAFTFTDIVKALKLGRATCHALLAGLVEEQYLYRNADKSYVIGPALVAIGKIASDQFSPLQAAQPEMRVLSDEFNLTCSMVYREGGDAVLHYRTGSGSQSSWTVRQGHHLPLRVPFAAPFFVLSKPEEVEQWVANLSPPASEAERQQLAGDLQFIRQHGYSAGEVNPGVKINQSAPELAFVGEQVAYPSVCLSEIDPAAEYVPSFLVAPVIGKHGEVEFALALSGFTGTMSGSQYALIGTRLREAAERITQFITGSKSAYPFKSAVNS